MREVVAAVVQKGALVLVAQRNSGLMKGKWEFPGGKVRPGESPEAALKREIHEELGVSIEVGEKLREVDFEVGERSYRLIAFLARHSSGEFDLRDHHRISWVGPKQLLDLDLTPPDVPIAQQVSSLLEAQEN